MKTSRALVAMLAALGSWAACESGGGAGGETHWLGDCNSDADCPAGQCLCNVCTRTCKGDGDCSGLRGAACFDSTSPGLAKRCAGSATKGAPGVCLGTCKEDGDCSSGELCLLGACVAAPHDEPDASEHVAPDAGGPSPGDIASGYVHVDAGASFGEPVEPPEPRPLIKGGDPLVGTWATLESDGSPCNPLLEISEREHLSNNTACPELVISRDAAGGISGHMTWARQQSMPPGQSTSFVPGPYAPATDPSKGYPTDVSSDDYRILQTVAPDVQYRVFDGTFDGTTLSFWISPFDLWADWCALQMPSPFQLDGMKKYRCVPPDASAKNTDLGKLALCVSPLDYGLCMDQFGRPEACVCVDEGNVLCSTNEVCTCTGTRCTSDLRKAIFMSDLKLSDVGLHGTMQENLFGAGQIDLNLMKVSP